MRISSISFARQLASFPMMVLCLILMFSSAADLYAAPSDTLRNTWVTGTVYCGKAENGYQHGNSLTVKIYRNGVRIAMVPCEKGLFRANLAGLARPQDLIEVVIWRGREDGSTVHAGTTVRTYLQYAQNLEMEVKYNKYPCGFPPRRCNRLYINNI